MKNPINQMKPLVLLTLVILLIVQAEMNFAQTPSTMDGINGKAKTLVKPEYPAGAIKTKANGTVNVQVTIDEQGNVVKAEAVSGDALLHEAAVKAARQSKFYPNVVKGKAVKMTGVLVFNFVAPASSENDYGGGADNLKKFIEDAINNKDNDKDPFSLKADSNILKNTVNSRTEDKCVSASFFEAKQSFSGGMTQELIDGERLKTIISDCDESIKSSAATAVKYYKRGISRYYLILKTPLKGLNWFFAGSELPLSRNLSDAAGYSDNDLKKSLADLQLFINDPNNSNFPDERKIAVMAMGEALAVSAVKDKKPELFQLALQQLDSAQKLKMLKDDDNVRYNKMILTARLTIDAVPKNNPVMAPSIEILNEIVARYMEYSGEAAQAEAIYRNNVQRFQEILKVRQGSANQNNAQICQSLTEMNTSFQTLKTNFVKLSEMLKKGELSGDADLSKQIELREAQQTKVQASITAAAGKYGCSIK